MGETKYLKSKQERGLTSESWKKVPDKKLTSLQDFYTYKNNQDLRINNSYKACDLGKYLAEDFDMLRFKATLEENIEQF